MNRSLAWLALAFLAGAVAGATLLFVWLAGHAVSHNAKWER